MKINYIKGDLLTTDCDIMAHGVNAQGVMGSGVAKSIRNKYPKAYEDYNKQYRTLGLTLGKILWVPIWEGPLIANCITQEFYGRDSTKTYINYEAIRSCMEGVHSEAAFEDEHNKKQTVAMPMIGAGLGGGEWDRIEAIIEGEFTEVVPNVYYL
jgi:O-acetyl-ADP-ribose deacetylase (regulator of RNase III)